MAGGSGDIPRPTHDPQTKAPLSERVQAAIRTHYTIKRQEQDLAKAYDRLHDLKVAMSNDEWRQFDRLTKEP